MRTIIKDKNNFIELINELCPDNIIKNINGITIDSRKVEDGDIYIALKGGNHDGHEYINSIYNKTELCISETKINKKKVVNLNKNNNEFICYLSRLWKNKSKAEIFAITGSNGKTTTKDLIYSIISKKHQCSKSIENHNNSIGLPLSFLGSKLLDKYAILELGASKPGEIKKLCDIFKPKYAIITNISNAHIENFKSIQDILKTKLALYQSLDNDGVAFIDNDSIHFKDINLDCKKITFSLKNDSDFKGHFDTAKKTLTINNKYQINIPEHLEHLKNLILSTFVIANHFNIDISVYQEVINSFQLPIGRGRIKKYNECNIIDDSYNANPESMLLGLKRFMDMKLNKKKKILVLGDMLELGTDSNSEHSKIGKFITNTNFDYMLTYGEKSKLINTNMLNKKIIKIHFDNFKNLKKTFDDLLKKDDWIYIKGSRSMNLDRLFKK